MAAIFDMDAVLKKRFPDTDQGLVLLLVSAQRLGRILDLDLQRSARLAGLEKSEHEVLTILWLSDPNPALSPSQLSQAIIQTTGGMSKTLRRLERANWVERVPDPNDGRGQLVRLTKAGSSLIDRHNRELFERWNSRLQAYSGSARTNLAQALWSFAVLFEEKFLGPAAFSPASSEKYARGQARAPRPEEPSGHRPNAGPLGSRPRSRRAP
jgi:DNA-binding MarR family transcriptional regulator